MSDSIPMGQSNPLTLDAIAKQAGVSRSTVSRVINNQRNVDPDTRAKVLAIVHSLNYHPNIVARGLAAGRTDILGLVIPMGVSALFTDPYFPLLIQGISSACIVHDLSVMLWLADPEFERRTIRQILQGGLIDGVLVASALIDDPVIEALAKSNMPFVLVGRYPSNGQISYVDVDNRNGAREMVAHLLRLGYRRVATISGPKNMIAGAERLQGYSTALRDRRMTQDPNLIVEGDFTEEGGHAAMQHLLPLTPDAVFAASDAMAVGALRALRDANKRVPEDIALVGFDDMPFATRTDPPLTTVRQPIQRAGSVAVDTLIDLVAHPDSPPRRIILPTELVIRASCGSALHPQTFYVGAHTS
jgi:LacI family transcriptional regulator, galactose operon repressor